MFACAERTNYAAFRNRTPSIRARTWWAPSGYALPSGSSSFWLLLAMLPFWSFSSPTGACVWISSFLFVLLFPTNWFNEYVFFSRAQEGRDGAQVSDEQSGFCWLVFGLVFDADCGHRHTLDGRVLQLWIWMAIWWVKILWIIINIL